jgi:hypothetical protein
MFCKNCGAALNPNQAICLNCGVKTGDGNTFCPNCGNPTTPGAEFCMSCGGAIKGGSLGGYDKTKMAIFAFFLGGFGVHNFLMGETKKGAIKIVLTCCTGLGSIFGMIDFIKIITDAYTIDPEKFI